MGVDLTNDERTVLLIAARGHPMLAIGRWQEPVLSLVQKGFMRRDETRSDVENYVISEAGRKASDLAEAEADRQMAGALRSWGDAR